FIIVPDLLTLSLALMSLRDLCENGRPFAWQTASGNSQVLASSPPIGRIVDQSQTELVRIGMVKFGRRSGGADRFVVVGFGQVLVKQALEGPDVRVLGILRKMAFDGGNGLQSPLRDRQLWRTHTTGQFGVQADGELPGGQ